VAAKLKPGKDFRVARGQRGDFAVMGPGGAGGVWCVCFPLDGDDRGFDAKVRAETICALLNDRDAPREPKQETLGIEQHATGAAPMADVERMPWA